MDPWDLKNDGSIGVSAFVQFPGDLEITVQDGMAQGRIRGPAGDFGPSTSGPKSSLWKGMQEEVNLSLGRGELVDIVRWLGEFAVDFAVYIWQFP